MPDSKHATDKDLRNLTTTVNRGFNEMRELTAAMNRGFNEIRNQFNGLRNQLSNQNMIIKEILLDVRQTKESVRHLRILYEDLDDRFTTLAEAVTDNLNVRREVDNHENRLHSVETDQKLLKKTVRIHSRQFKNKPA